MRSFDVAFAPQVRQLTSANSSLEKELVANKLVVRDSFTEVVTLRASLEAANKELADLRAQYAARDDEQVERALSAEMSLRQKMQMEFESSTKLFQEEKLSLTSRIEELGQTLTQTDAQRLMYILECYSYIISILVTTATINTIVVFDITTLMYANRVFGLFDFLFRERGQMKNELSRLMQRLQEAEAHNDELSQVRPCLPYIINIGWAFFFYLTDKAVSFSIDRR